jgi:hypothetical protein
MEDKGMVDYAEFTLKKAEKAIRRIARMQRISEAEVRREMEIAMLEGYNNPDPAVQAEWAKAPFAGRIPSVEEFIVWCADRVSGNCQMM